jgi:hypothetical protein
VAGLHRMFAERLAQRRARIAIVLALSLLPSMGLGQLSTRRAARRSTFVALCWRCSRNSRTAAGNASGRWAAQSQIPRPRPVACEFEPSAWRRREMDFTGCVICYDASSPSAGPHHQLLRLAAFMATALTWKRDSKVAASGGPPG